MTRDLARVFCIPFCFSAFQVDFRESHGLSSSLNVGFQAGPTALRLTAGMVPVSVTELLGSAQRLLLLGLGPVCFCAWALPSRTASGFSPVQFWFSPTGLVRFSSVRFGRLVQSGSVQFDQFGLIIMIKNGNVGIYLRKFI